MPDGDADRCSTVVPAVVNSRPPFGLGDQSQASPAPPGRGKVFLARCAGLHSYRPARPESRAAELTE